ncbi:MAG TPA: alpha/beta fold hydrolase [Acidimicrobiales bacterium]|nr:alpha/beta fold hydrolase [Acidimicrobiales bacterium]
MATFVLVHGAMHGGWCWSDVAQRLRAHGHDVHCPTLTGQGDRRQALSPGVGVTTHVDDLADVLWFEDLDQVHLVLHSYAGMLAGPLAARAADRLAAVVFAGAFLGGPGQSLADIEPPEVAARYRQLAADEGDGWFVPPSDAFLEQWGLHDPALRARVGSRLTDFPLRCVLDPVEFDPAPLAALRKAYIRHTEPWMDSLARSYAAAVAAGWATYDIACGHDLMLAAPDATAALLERIAGD